MQRPIVQTMSKIIEATKYSCRCNVAEILGDINLYGFFVASFR
jgi:hypothetical protein